MSLTDGTSKMSKSDPVEGSRINLTDSPDIITKKASVLHPVRCHFPLCLTRRSTSRQSWATVSGEPSAVAALFFLPVRGTRCSPQLLWLSDRNMVILRVDAVFHIETSLIGIPAGRDAA